MPDPAASSRVTSYTTLAGLATLVIGWRLVAFLYPSEVIDIPPGLPLPMTVMGLAFFACGVLVLLRYEGAATRAFVIYATGSAVHWGGSIGRPSELQMTFLFLYLAASVAGEAGLLDLALHFSPTARAVRGHRWLYLPAVSTAAFAPFASRFDRPVLNTIAGLVLLVATILSFTGGAVFLVRLLRGRLDASSRNEHLLVLAVMIAASVVAALGVDGTLPAPGTWSGEVYNLLLLAIPATLASVLLRRQGAAAS